VEEIGPAATAFQEGQAVYGQTAKGVYQGAYAEYALASTEVLAPKPLNLDFDEAASVPAGAMTAWQALFDHGRLQAGQRVLIHGAAGGVGLFAVQFAKWKGASVIGTASAANEDFLRALGVDTFIDYRSIPFERVAHDMDLVVDPIGGQTQERSWQVLKPGGTLVVLGASPLPGKAQAYGVRAVKMVLQPSGDLLRTIAELIEAGHVKTAVAKGFPLSEVKLAHELSQSGHGRGRIVLHIAD
jgi:NADPH:quinone reductase-like Zn-dependent oxidoreductase